MKQVLLAAILSLSWLQASLAFSHRCDPVYDKAIADAETAENAWKWLLVKGTFFSSALIVGGAVGAVISPLSIFSKEKYALSRAVQYEMFSLAVLGAGSAMLLGTATYPLLMPFNVLRIRLIKNNLQKTKSLLKEIDESYSGPLVSKLASKVQECTSDDMLMRIKNFNFCPSNAVIGFSDMESALEQRRFYIFARVPSVKDGFLSDFSAGQKKFMPFKF